MTILSVKKDASTVRVQSVNGIKFIEEGWMKQTKKDRQKRKN